MRLRACIGGLLLASTGCAQMPDRVRIDLDGRVIELQQPGEWATSADCAAHAPPSDIAKDGKAILLVGPDRLLITGKDGRTWSLYRCRV